METLRALPESVRAGVFAAPIAAGAAMLMGSDAYIMHALSYGVVTSAATYLAPMVTLDPAMQLLAVGAGGLGAQMLAGDERVPGSALMAAGIPAGSLYAARQFA